MVPVNNSLPARLLGSLGTPLGSRGRSVPGGGSALGLAPLSSRGGSSEASGGSLPLAGGGEARLDGGNTLLLNAGQLLLFELVLGLSLGIAVWIVLVGMFVT